MDWDEIAVRITCHVGLFFVVFFFFRESRERKQKEIEADRQKLHF